MMMIMMILGFWKEGRSEGSGAEVEEGNAPEREAGIEGRIEVLRQP